MDIIDYIEIPSFEKRRDRFKRNFTVLTGAIAIAAVLEKYNGTITRGLQSVRRGLTAGLASWLEDQSGTQLFTLEGEEPAPLTHSALELEALAEVHRSAGKAGLAGSKLGGRHSSDRTSGGGNASAGAAGASTPAGARGAGGSGRRVAADAAATAAHHASVVVTQLPSTEGAATSTDGSAAPGLAGASSSAQLAFGGDGQSPGDAAAVYAGGAGGVGPGGGDDGATPQFFQSTKFFAVLDVDEARELFGATTRITLAPHEVLFTAGQPSDSGIYIVVRGSLGVFLDDASGGPPIHANTLRYGESVGDLDVVDGAPRSVSCIALGEGALLVQVSRPLFLAFVAAHPRALMLYLQQGLARLWRVAHFMLSDFLQLTLHKPGLPTAGAAAAATPMAPPPASNASVCIATQTSTGLDGGAGGAGVPGGSVHNGSLHGGSSAALAAARGSSASSRSTSCDHLVGLMSQSIHILEEALAHGHMGPAGVAAVGAKNGGNGRDGNGSVHGGSLHGANAAAAAGLGNGRPSNTSSSASDAESAAATAALAQHLQGGSQQQAVGGAASPTVTRVHHGHHVHPHGRSSGSFKHPPSGSTTTPIQEETEGDSDSGASRSPSPQKGSSAVGLDTVAAQAASTSQGAASPATAGGAASRTAAASPAAAAAPTPALRMPPEPEGPFCLVASAAVPPGAMPPPPPALGSAPPTAFAMPALASDPFPPPPTTSTASSSGIFYGSMPPPVGVASSGPSRTASGGAPWGSGVGLAGPGMSTPAGGVGAGGGGGGGLVDVGLRAACLAEGWDVIGPHEVASVLGPGLWAALTDVKAGHGSPFPLVRGGVLQEIDWACGQFYLLAEGHLLAERTLGDTSSSTSSGGTSTGGGANGLRSGAASSPAQQQQQAGTVVSESAVIVPGSIISSAAFLSSTAARCRVVATEPARLVAFGWQHLEAMMQGTAPAAPVGPGGRRAPAAMTMLGRSPSSLALADHGAHGHGSSSTQNASSSADLTPPPPSPLLLPLLLATARAMGPLIRRFISLGLNRVWLKSGELAYAQGEEATCLYVVISGRLRLMHTSAHPVTGRTSLRVEEEVGRGEAVGAVWTITGGHHDTTALCVRDSELVRMSKAAFKIIAEDSPMALSKLFSNIARRLVAAWDARMRGAKVVGGGGAGLPPSLGTPAPRPPLSMAGSPLAGTGMAGTPGGPGAGSDNAGGVPPSASHHADIVTIAVVPAGVMPALTAATVPSTGRPSAVSAPQPPGVASLVAVKRLAAALKEALSSHGSVLCVNSTSLGILFPSASERLDVLFYRSKITSWLSAQEEEYRFIILEADYHPTPWSSVCCAQADCILLVAAEGAQPGMGECEGRLVFGPGLPVIPAAAVQRTNTHASLATPASTASAPTHAPSSIAAGGQPGRNVATGAPGASPFSNSGAAAAIAAATGTVTSSGTGHNGHTTQAPSMSQLMHGASGSLTASSGAFVSPLIAAANAAAAADAAGSAGPGTPAKPLPYLSAANSTSSPVGADSSSRGAPSRSASFAAPSPVGPASQGRTGALAAAAAAATAAAATTNTSTATSATGSAAAGLGGLGAAGGGSGLASLRRVELVLLHPPAGELPSNTAAWLSTRAHVTRHHHVRLAHEADVARLARWMAGRAVGLVLSGGGSRGLAHLGVLCALEDAGVAVDVVGGTSQGAFMAGLYAQGLGREALQVAVQYYARRMGSMRHLLADLTLPLLSLFSGAAFDDALRATFAAGAPNIEDLWLPFFCVSTNLTRGEPSVHTRGCLWRLVRASMTIVGLLPPLYEGGDLLVDGGYMNNLPVDVMRSLGVDTVIVVDVEGKDDTGWRNLQPYDGGVSGWRLLWDRWCPVPSWRYGTRMPRYSQIINQLTWMTHAHNLRRVSEDYRIDLYLRPPNIASYKLMDFHLMERIVKDAYRYASLAVSKWPLLSRVATAPAGGAHTGGAPQQGAAVAAAAAAAALPVFTPPPPSPLYAPASPMPPPIPSSAPGTPAWPLHMPTASGATAPYMPPPLAMGMAVPGAGLGGAASPTGRAGATSPQPQPGMHPTSSIMCMSQLQKKQQASEGVGGGSAGAAGSVTSPSPPHIGLVTASSATAPPPSASALAAGILHHVSLGGRHSQSSGRHTPSGRATPSAAAGMTMQPQGTALSTGHSQHASHLGPGGAGSSGQQAHVVRWGQAMGAAQQAQMLLQQQQGQALQGEARVHGGSSGAMLADHHTDGAGPLQAAAAAVTPSRPLSKMTKVKTRHSLLDLASAVGDD